MKFRITKSSDPLYEEEIEINTLEELLDLQRREWYDLILIDGREIEIYDDYRE